MTFVRVPYIQNIVSQEFIIKLSFKSYEYNVAKIQRRTIKTLLCITRAINTYAKHSNSRNYGKNSSISISGDVKLKEGLFGKTD